MSINKKLGGARLRLVIGLAAVMAVFGAVVATTLDPGAVFNPDEVNATVAARLDLSNMPNGTYVLTPKDQEGTEDGEGWAMGESQSGLGTLASPYIFDESNPAITITANGSKTVYIMTENPTESDDEKETSIEVHEDTANGDVVATAPLLVFEQ